MLVWCICECTRPTINIDNDIKEPPPWVLETYNRSYIDIWWICQGERIGFYIWYINWVNITILNHIDIGRAILAWYIDPNSIKTHMFSNIQTQILSKISNSHQINIIYIYIYVDVSPTLVWTYLLREWRTSSPTSQWPNLNVAIVLDITL